MFAPLEWTEADEDTGECEADAIMGAYLVVPDDAGKLRVVLSYASGQQMYQTVVVSGVGMSSAKEAAEAHYQHRMADTLISPA